ncbi:helix-turn-helix transcriptional regulator [Candidatus Avoscillospira sp. LCP25S3_F1]|uniref:helix-turn-helix transcriptional regulator n=1 Tax=Candidatus Avoscillospira sp. LCP25S3_F1 TaxID=3438825 RepID=UPI003F910553
MSINHNLKRLRQIAGLTQEEVADKIGLTRQAISGYESGRRQPDIAMIEQLAQLYHTDILEILYGNSAKQKELRRFHRAAILTMILPLLLIFLRSCILLGMNRLLPMVDGQFQLIESSRPMLETRMSVRMTLLQIGDALGSLSNLSALIGCIVLVVLSKNLCSLPSGKASILYVLSFLVGTIVVTVPFVNANMKVSHLAGFRS